MPAVAVTTRQPDVGGGVGVGLAVGVGVGVGVGEGVGVGVPDGPVTKRNLESLGISLEKTVTRAGPGGKITGTEVKVASDQEVPGFAGRKTI